MSETSARKPDDASSDADQAEAKTSEAKKSEGQEPSLQEHHDPATEADSASGGPAE